MMCSVDPGILLGPVAVDHDDAVDEPVRSTGHRHQLVDGRIVIRCLVEESGLRSPSQNRDLIGPDDCSSVESAGDRPRLAVREMHGEIARRGRVEVVVVSTFVEVWGGGDVVEVEGVEEGSPIPAGRREYQRALDPLRWRPRFDRSPGVLAFPTHVAHSSGVSLPRGGLDPRSCAVVTMECQRGVIGDLATFPMLLEAVESSGMVPHLIELVDAARRSSVPVVHALAHFRSDRLGSRTNAPLLAHAALIDGQLLEGSPSAELIAGLAGDGRDVCSFRHHGVSPFTGTDLDAILRSANVDTIVACGVSLNVGVLGLCIEAVNLGYEVVLAADATTAVPVEYRTALMRNTLSQLCVAADVAEITTAWMA